MAEDSSKAHRFVQGTLGRFHRFPPFALSPSLIRRRMASARGGRSGCFRRHSSTSAKSAGSIRISNRSDLGLMLLTVMYVHQRVRIVRIFRAARNAGFNNVAGLTETPVQEPENGYCSIYHIQA